MPHKPANTHGFTLIELAIVIAIISVVLGAGLSVYGNRLAAERAAETSRRLDIIEDALKLFRQTHGRLPSPANGAVISGPSVGIESYSITTGLVSTGSARIGVVPTRALNLPDSLMLDGYGNRITYAVDVDCITTWTAQCGWTGSTVSNLRVLDSTGTMRTGAAVYVLVSHGANGVFAWQEKSASQVSTALPRPGTVYGSTLEAENANSNYSFRDMQRVETDAATTRFDDFVRWKVREQL